MIALPLIWWIVFCASSSTSSSGTLWISSGPAVTLTSCVPSSSLYSGATCVAISGGPPDADVSAGCHFDQFL
jgi:hypothetical protein